MGAAPKEMRIQTVMLISHSLSAGAILARFGSIITP